MKVFISWSGPQSLEIAGIFREWIPTVLQAAEPFISSEDIRKGTRWIPEMAGQLEQSQIGIICITPENVNEPWILFEAGALSKSIETARVRPILFEISPSNIIGPLAQFQLTNFTKSDISKLVKTISLTEESKLTDEILERSFEKWWPELEERVDAVLKTAPTQLKAKTIRSELDIVEEILALTRDMHSKTRDLSTQIDPISTNELLALRNHFERLEHQLEQNMDTVPSQIVNLSTQIRTIISELLNVNAHSLSRTEVSGALELLERAHRRRAREGASEEEKGT